MHPQVSLLQSSARSRQRGAVLLEALIVCIFMVLVLVGMVIVFKSFSAKWRTMQDARAAAWVTALEGCGAASVDGVYQSVHERSKDPEAATCGETCEGQSLEGLGNDGSGPAPAWIDVSRAETKTATITFDGFFLGERSVTSSYAMSCNEKQNREELNLGSSSLFEGTLQAARNIINEEFYPDRVGEKSDCYFQWVGKDPKVADTPCEWGLPGFKWITKPIEVDPVPLE